jgi:hypothetical protein
VDSHEEKAGWLGVSRNIGTAECYLAEACGLGAVVGSLHGGSGRGEGAECCRQRSVGGGKHFCGDNLMSLVKTGRWHSVLFVKLADQGCTMDPLCFGIHSIAGGSAIAGGAN